MKDIGEDEDEKEYENEEKMPSLSDFTEPQLVGRTCASRLLWEIQQGGIVDSTHQHFPLFFMALSDEYAVSKVRLGKLTPYALQFLRHLKDFLGVTFIFDQQKEDGTLVVSCVGVGVKNVAKKSF